MAVLVICTKGDLMSGNDECRRWLRENGYEDIADRIDAIILKWKTEGKKTRRNWWDILAGGKGGKPCTVAGYEFPVLKSAQRRKGVPITPYAISRSRKEAPQMKWQVARWNMEGDSDDAEE